MVRDREMEAEKAGDKPIEPSVSRGANRNGLQSARGSQVQMSAPARPMPGCAINRDRRVDEPDRQVAVPTQSGQRWP
jgi:hypothetical protein